MKEEGKYIYCIIETKIEGHFGPIGIGERGDEVTTVSHRDLSMVVSNSPMTKYVLSRENLLAHEKVTEEVMKEFTVLPVRFCTIASNADEIRRLLERRYREFKILLKEMDHKIELGVKGLWKDMGIIFRQITKENDDIRRLKEKIQHERRKRKLSALKPPLETEIEVGRLVKEALLREKEKEAGRLIEALRRTAYDYKLNETMSDDIFMNAAFLVGRGNEREFDNVMDDLSKQWEARTKFVYAGPLPPYNFVNITIYPEEWEK